MKQERVVVWCCSLLLRLVMMHYTVLCCATTLSCNRHRIGLLFMRRLYFYPGQAVIGAVTQLTLIDTRLRLVLEAMQARVSLLDRDQRHCYVNNEYAELAGQPVEVGRFVTLGTERTNVGVTQIIAVNQNDVGSFGGEGLDREGKGSE